MGTAIDVGGSGGKASGKKFVEGSRGSVLFLVRSDVAKALAYKDGQIMPLTADKFGRVWIRDSQIPLVVEALGQLGLTNSLLEALVKGIIVQNTVKVQTKVVTCPLEPIQIPGIGTGSAYEATDCMGTIFMVEVPTSGEIVSATFWDLDDEGLQTDFEIFKHEPRQTADNSNWAPTDEDLLKLVTELAFFAFDDHGGGRTSELKNIGKGYTAPEGKFYIQAIARGAQDIAALNIPRFQLQIRSDDPTWQEV